MCFCLNPFFPLTIKQTIFILLLKGGFMQKELANADDAVGNYNEISTAISSDVFVCIIYNYAIFSLLVRAFAF